ncbi:hypothetical protein ACQJBY_001707 [Aegilops geniculata]
MQHRVEPWKGRWLSKAARVILINSSLASLLWFLMSFYRLHETLHQEVAKYQSKFFWAGEGDKQKYHMAVIQLLPVLRIGTSISVGSGSSTLFWFDRWLGDSPLAARFPGLFAIAADPRISVETTLIDLRRLAFRRSFGPQEVDAWDALLQDIALLPMHVEGTADSMAWRLEPSRSFSTKSLYAAIAPSLAPEPFSLIWDIRLPLKIRIFLWQWIRGRLPSGVEVRKRNGPGDGMCPLCATVEDSNHIFFNCSTAQFLWSCFRETVGEQWCNTNFPDLLAEIHASSARYRHISWLCIGILAWTLWNIHNKLVIQKVPLRHATDAIFKMCGYLQLWRPLSRPQDRNVIDTLLTDLRSMAFRMAPPLPPPPPEPD